jgi:hypothetical protein
METQRKPIPVIIWSSPHVQVIPENQLATYPLSVITRLAVSDVINS